MDLSKEERFNYAYYTFRAGTRTFDGLEMLLESLLNNYKAITYHNNNTFSDTNDLLAKNAFSSTAIIMSYTLLEGFFSEEHDYYIGGKKPNHLVNLIEDVFKSHNLAIEKEEYFKEKTDLVRQLRNAAVHSNGVFKKALSDEVCQEYFGEAIFYGNRKYPLMSFKCSLKIVWEFRDFASEYSKIVFEKSCEQ